MANLRPVELEIEGFRSFVDKSIIKFPDIERGAILINGTYKDGTTSSGSGKSSILMALAFALGTCDVPSTELKSWYSKKMNVRLRLSDGQNVYDVIRDPKLKLVVNGKEFEGTSVGAKEKLDEILKAPSELIKALTYRPQREKGTFLSNTDSKNKEFLTKILGLDSVESASDIFAKQVSAIDQNILMLQSNLDQLNASYQSSMVSDGDLVTAQESLNTAQARVSELTSSQESINANNEEINQIRLEIQKIRNAEMEVNNSKQQNVAIRAGIESIQSEIIKLKSGICPTCEREWQKFQALVDSKTNEMMKLGESMKYNLTVINNATPMINPDHQKVLGDRLAALQMASAQLASPMNDANTSVQMAQNNYNTLKRMKDMNTGLLSQISEKQEQIQKAKIESHITSHCSSLVGRQGFLGGIFDEVLSEIKMRSNDLMSYIPNINTFSIDISSSSVTQAGKVNKKIKVSMFKDGEQKSLKALSGGQMASSELCTDLAVSETIRSRSGSSLGWVALDEAMDGLDVETKIAALDIIKSKVDGLLIVVDHSTEIKEAFDTVIEVEYDGKRSYVI